MESPHIPSFESGFPPELQDGTLSLRGFLWRRHWSACRWHRTGVWFERALQPACGRRLSPREGRMGLDACLRARRAVITNVNTVVKRKWGIWVSISLTSTGHLILGLGLLLHSEPKIMLQLLIFTRKVIFETRKARKTLSALERMGGDQARNTGT